MKTTIIFYPNELKKSKRTERIPLYLRIFFKGKKMESRLNFEIAESELSKWDPFTMRMQERNSAVNHYLNRIEQKFQDFRIMEATTLNEHSAETIRNVILGLDKKTALTVMKFTDQFYENNVLKNSNRVPGTIKGYRRAINHLRNFLISRNQQNLTLDKLNYDVASDFKNYLVNKNPSLNMTGMKEVSAAGVIKKFRTIFEQAVEKELISKNPFKQVKISAKSPHRERLTIHQVKKLWDLDLLVYPAQEIYRDLFIFIILTGLAYHDLISLTWYKKFSMLKYLCNVKMHG